MQIQRIRVTHFRKLAGPVEIGELPPGLAIIGGANEQGKSTLLEAIRAALFEKHSLGGEAARAMQPLDAAVAPEVELDFSVGGTTYHLWKRFVSKAAAKLHGAGQVWADDAAEEQLQALLGFERPGRGRSKSEHHGLWGLLWVSQGETFQAVHPHATARSSLTEVLDTEVGEVLGGDVGPALLQHFTNQRSHFWTKTGKPRGPLQEARKIRDQARKAREEAQARLDQEAERREQLARLEQELERMRTEGIVADLEARLQEAKARQQELARRRQAVHDAEQQERLAITEREQAQSQWQRRLELRNAVTDLQRQEAERAEAVTACQQETERVMAERERLAQLLRDSEEALDRLRARERHLEGLQRRERVLDERTRVADTLDKAVAAEAALRAARKAANAIGITDQAVEALRRQEQTLAEAEARLQGAATQLRLEVNVDYQVSGEIQADESDYRITGAAQVNLDGIGHIQIQAGGSELPEQKERARRARRERDATLAELGVGALAEAEDRLERRKAQEQEANQQAQRLAAFAPEEAGGLASVRERLDQLDADLNGLPTPAADDPAGEALSAAFESARRERESAERTRDQARQAFDTQQRLAQEAEHRLIQARTRLEELQGTRERQQRLLDKARTEIDDDTLARTLYDKQAHEEATAAAARQARESLEDLDPEEIERQLQQAQDAITQAREREQRLEREAEGLRHVLRELGAEGLSEQAADLAREEEAAERQAAAVEREAAAVWRAAEVLEEAAREARQAYLAPLNRHLGPYLRYLFPDAEPVLSDTLEIRGLQRDGREESFSQLSIGAREQVAVLTRLAFADLLAESGGEPPPVILDDALVYADQERFETMKHLLARSARKHQVIVLTCRPMDYLSLGATEFLLRA
ncbi:MAG: AAA family ATPase [Halorhodospira sp.]